jgi:hypothetical protein
VLLAERIVQAGRDPGCGHPSRELVACAHVAAEEDGAGYFGMFSVGQACRARAWPGALLAEAERIAKRAAGAAADAHDRDRPARRTHRLVRAPRLPPHRHQEALSLRRRALRHPPRDDLRFEILEKTL